MSNDTLVYPLVLLTIYSSHGLDKLNDNVIYRKRTAKESASKIYSIVVTDGVDSRLYTQNIPLSAKDFKTLKLLGFKPKVYTEKGVGSEVSLIDFIDHNFWNEKIAPSGEEGTAEKEINHTPTSIQEPPSQQEQSSSAAILNVLDSIEELEKEEKEAEDISDMLGTIFTSEEEEEEEKVNLEFWNNGEEN